MSAARVYGSPPSDYAAGEVRDLTQTTGGALNVAVVSGGGGGGNAAAGATGAAVPADAGYTGFSNASGSLVGVSPTNPLPVAQGTVTPGAGTTSVVTTAGTAVAAAAGPWKGGIVQNPPSGSGTLYINLVSTAGTVAGGTTFALSAGDSRDLPPVSSGVTLSVNASSSSYTFCLEIDT
jgi:hypothetical protein